MKDSPVLLRAFARLRRTLDARLIIVGEGPERPKLERLVREFGIEGHTQLPGFVADPAPYLGGAAALALTSRFEAAPTVIIEALAAGTPVVATDCPVGPRELLAEGAYGTSVPMGDVEALAASLVAVIQQRPRPVPAAAWSPHRVPVALAGYVELLDELSDRRRVSRNGR